MSKVFSPGELIGLLRAERAGRALDESIYYWATRDFRERTKSKLVKIMIWAGIVVITFAIAVRVYQA
jgi:hypothetical protein